MEPWKTQELEALKTNGQPLTPWMAQHLGTSRDAALAAFPGLQWSFDALPSAYDSPHHCHACKGTGGRYENAGELNPARWEVCPACEGRKIQADAFRPFLAAFRAFLASHPDHPERYNAFSLWMGQNHPDAYGNRAALWEQATGQDPITAHMENPKDPQWL